MVGTLLTVVVPTIPGRESLLSRCLATVLDQAPSTVEVIVVDGPGLMGDKVTLAMSVATGEYATVVDDDDYLAADYMARVLPACDGVVDFVGLRIEQWIDGELDGVSTVRGGTSVFGRWDHGPTPKGVTRTRLWRQCRLKNHYTADRAWCSLMAALIESWAFVDGPPVYVYDHHGSAFHGGEARQIEPHSFDESRVVRLHL